MTTHQSQLIICTQVVGGTHVEASTLKASLTVPWGDTDDVFWMHRHAAERLLTHMSIVGDLVVTDFTDTGYKFRLKASKKEGT